jgi:hypothetical protein
MMDLSERDQPFRIPDQAVRREIERSMKEKSGRRPKPDELRKIMKRFQDLETEFGASMGMEEDYIPRDKRWGKKPGHHRFGSLWQSAKPTSLRRTISHQKLVHADTALRRLRYDMTSGMRSIRKALKFEGAEE